MPILVISAVPAINRSRTIPRSLAHGTSGRNASKDPNSECHENEQESRVNFSPLRGDMLWKMRPVLTLFVGLVFFLGDIPSYSQSTGTLTGNVELSLHGQRTKEPIKNAWITLYSLRRVLQTQSGEAGQFSFVDVPVGMYDLEAKAAGFQTWTSKHIEVNKTNSAPLHIGLPIANPPSHCDAGSSVSYGELMPESTNILFGIVERYGTGGPITDAELSLSRSDSNRVAAVTTSNQDGEFQFPHLQPGIYTLTARHRNYSEARIADFWVPAENSTRLAVFMLEQRQILLCQ